MAVLQPQAVALFHALPSASCRYDFNKALLHDSELLGVHQWPWVRKSRGREETSLTCLLLPGGALQRRQGSEDLTPFLRVIDNNFLERPFIPGLRTSFEYLWRISSVASLMGSSHKAKKRNNWDIFFFFPCQSNGSLGNVCSRRNKHFRIPICSKLQCLQSAEEDSKSAPLFFKAGWNSSTEIFSQRNVGFPEKNKNQHFYIFLWENVKTGWKFLIFWWENSKWNVLFWTDILTFLLLEVLKNL